MTGTISYLNIWQFMEWSGAFFGLGGSLIMASRRLNPAFSWIAWLMSNVFYIALFSLNTHQHGLLLMHIGGIAINSLGLYQWSRHKEVINHTLMNLLLTVSIICMLASASCLLLVLFYPSIQHLEWLGALLGLAASFLLASRHRWAFNAWFLWTVGNALLLMMSVYTRQYGLLTLQAGFMIINCYGCYMTIQQLRQKIA